MKFSPRNLFSDLHREIHVTMVAQSRGGDSYNSVKQVTKIICESIRELPSFFECPCCSYATSERPNC